MSSFHYGFLVFGLSVYIIASKSYQIPVEEKSQIQHEQQQQLPKQQQHQEKDSEQAYFDVNGGNGLSDNRPAVTFEDVIRILKDDKKGEISPAITASPATSLSPVSRPEKPIKGRVATSEETTASQKNFPGLMDLDSDDENDTPAKQVKPEEPPAVGSSRGARPVEYDADLNRPGPGRFTTPSPPPSPPPQPTASLSETRKKYLAMTEDQKTEEKNAITPIVVSDGDLRALFINSGTGSSAMIPGCELVHFHVKSRCAGNLLELTLLSRNPLKGQVRLLEGDGQVNMDGTNLIVYGVLGPLSPSGNIWKLTKRVLKKDLEGECDNCDNMNVRVVLKVGDATCGMAVSCQQKTSAKLVPVAVEDSAKEQIRSTTPSPFGKESPPPTPASAEPPIQDPGNTAKTTMMLTYGDSNPDMTGRAVTGMVSLGTRMNLVLSVFSRDVTLDLHVVRCQAKGDDGRGVLLVKDGCSVSSVIGEFREVLGIVQESSFGSHDVRRVSQFADISAFNFRRSPQNITLICTIKMCGGECTERPSCVDSDINTMRSTRPAVPIFTQEVTLGKTFYVGGLPLEPTAEMLNLMLEMEPRNEQPVMTEKNPEDCVSRKTLLIIIGILSALYLGILLLCIYTVRRSSVRAVKGHIMEDYESPPKALYSEYNSPRRRTTPQTSPDNTTFSINAEGFKSPILQRSV